MPKSVDGLMRYLRDKKGISISGSTQKRKLRNIGYYHGYKGFRFIGKSTNAIPYTDFKELMAIYEFDMQLKSLLYPQLMFIETALKNYVLEEILLEGNSANGLYAIFGRKRKTKRSIKTSIISARSCILMSNKGVRQQEGSCTAFLPQGHERAYLGDI